MYYYLMKIFLFEPRFLVLREDKIPIFISVKARLFNVGRELLKRMYMELKFTSQNGTNVLPGSQNVCFHYSPKEGTI
jgi:hypothetical protein